MTTKQVLKCDIAVPLVVNNTKTNWKISGQKTDAGTKDMFLAISATKRRRTQESWQQDINRNSNTRVHCVILRNKNN